MKRRLLVAAFACAGLAGVALPAGAQAANKTVYAGNPPQTKAVAHKLGITKKFEQTYNPGINAFFRKTVTINQGDSVTWVGLAQNFHTVDLPPTGGRDLPLIVAGAVVNGVKDVAGHLFWFNGKVPSLGFNPKLLGPSGGTTYDGSKRVESGLPAGPGASNKLKVTFTKPGVYKYFCDVHPGMIGYVIVKAKGAKVPSAKQDTAALLSQLKADIRTAKRLPKAKLKANHVSLGLAGAGGVELYTMFPAVLRVTKGSVVTFAMGFGSTEAHTASFGPVKYLKMLASSLTSPAFAQQAAYPSSPPAAGAIVLNAKAHGNGFANTGVLDRDPTTPLPASAAIKFTQAGVYRFVCLIHPFMQGEIIVK